MKPKLTFYQHLTHAKEMLKQGHEIEFIVMHLKEQGLEQNTITEIAQFLQPNKRNKTQTASALIFWA